MHSCVYICIFLICTRFFFIIIKSSCYRVWNLNINFIHIIFLVFFFKICICMSSYLLTKSALFCIDFRSTAVCMQCVRTKSYRWTTFLFSFKSNPRWNKLTSASVGLLIWSGSTTSCILLFEQEAFNEFTLVEPIGGNLPTCSHMPLAMLCR